MKLLNIAYTLKRVRRLKENLGLPTRGALQKDPNFTILFYLFGNHGNFSKDLIWDKSYYKMTFLKCIIVS